MNNLAEVDALLKTGAEKAALVANGVLGRVRQKLGFGAI
jgi:tryptophanyl-tRNA synthetase